MSKRYSIQYQKRAEMVSQSIGTDSRSAINAFVKRANDLKDVQLTIYDNELNDYVYYKPQGATKPVIDFFGEDGSVDKPWCARVWVHGFKGWYIETEEMHVSEAAAMEWGDWYLKTWPNVHSISRHVEVFESLPFTAPIEFDSLGE